MILLLKLRKYGGDTRKISLDINIDDKNIERCIAGIDEKYWILMREYI